MNEILKNKYIFITLKLFTHVSCTFSGFNPACAIAALLLCIAKSVAEISFNLPPKAPKAVRLAPTIKTGTRANDMIII